MMSKLTPKEWYTVLRSLITKNNELSEGHTKILTKLLPDVLTTDEAICETLVNDYVRKQKLVEAEDIINDMSLIDSDFEDDEVNTMSAGVEIPHQRNPELVRNTEQVMVVTELIKPVPFRPTVEWLMVTPKIEKVLFDIYESNNWEYHLIHQDDKVKVVRQIFAIVQYIK